MREKRVSIITIAALMLLAGILPLMMNAGAEPPTRAPDKYGHITSDQTWDDTGDKTYWVDDIIIDEGVTVTIASGMNIKFYAGSYFWVRGTLDVQGTQGRGMVNFGEEDGINWDGMVINETGSATMKNFTVQGAIGDCLHILGGDNLIENANMNGGRSAVWLEGSDGKDTIRNIVSIRPFEWGMVKGYCEGHTYVEGFSVHNPGMGGFGFEGASNITLKNPYVRDPGMYYSWLIRSTNIHFDKYRFVDTSWTNHTYGHMLSNMVRDCTFVNGYMEGLNVGFGLDTPWDSNIRVEGLVTDRTVVEGIRNMHLQTKMHLEFVDCHIDTSINTTYIDVSEPGLYVDFINTTWDIEDALLVRNQAVLNVSWYLEAEVVDGNGEPLDTNFRINWQGGGRPFDGDYPEGIIRPMPVKFSTQRGESRPVIYFNDYQFRSNDYPSNMIKIDDFVLSENTGWDITMDLAPYNDMPGELHVDEDEWLELDLNDHFTDPEGQPMAFLLDHSPNLNIVRTGGPTSGNIRIRNQQPDWYGTGWLKITAIDAGLNQTMKNVTIIVDPVNDAPEMALDLPMITMKEDSTTYFNLSGYFTDAEDDDIIYLIPDYPSHRVELNTTTLNLTIEPEENFYGLIRIEINATDGKDWTVEDLLVNVTPVNDPPEAVVRYPNGSKAMTEEVPLTPSENVTAWILDLDEDGSIAFRIDATDVDSEELTYSFMEDDLEHGMIEVETYRVEVIINTTTNETEMQNVTVPMNFTYTPYANDFRGDLVRFMVDDGELNVTFRVMFRVAAVNDPPVLDIPEEWNITVNMDSEYMLDLASMLSDIDGDTLVITTNSDFATVNQTEITFLYNNTFTEALEEVDIMVSDGTVTRTWKLTVNVIATSDDDDDDDEPSISDVKVTGKEDSWTVEVTGDEGMTIFFIVEDEDGNRASYPLTYSSGKYTAEVPKEDAEKGYDYWISDTENGDTLEDAWSGSLPSLKEEQDDDFPLWIIILILVAVILFALVILLVVSSRRTREDLDEE